MKKFKTYIIWALVAVVAITGTVLGIVLPKKNNDNLIRINEVTHSIFYAPFYAAINLGYFEEYDIEVELTNGNGSNNSMAALVGGTADVILAGPETAVYVAASGKKDIPQIFGALTKKDGSFILSRAPIATTPEGKFDLKSLEGKEILAGRVGGMPAMTLEYVIDKTEGVDKSKITIDKTISFGDMASVFLGGRGDFATFFEPTASAILGEHPGEYFYATGIGELLGEEEVPYTAFITNESYLKKNGEKLTNFLKAVEKALTFLKTASDEEIVASLAPSFVGTADEVIVSSVDRYLAIDAWYESPAMSETAFESLKAVLNHAGELPDPASVQYSKVVNNELANKI
ncbi:MAG: ABC transporter substrate-binding protein [Christensenellaceae bacterium]|nr:ABC transporter substrate-binding protein [Christensenellaceae bacterium]